MELIDKQKILGWRSEKLRECADYGNISGSEVLTMLREAIESGTFDDLSAQEEIAKLKRGVLTGEYMVLSDGREVDIYRDPLEVIAEIRERVIQAEQEREQLAAFIRDMIRDGCWNIDGGDLQDKAEKLGLLRAEIYDPEKHGDDFDGEPGEDEIYVFSGLLEKTKL